MPTINNNPYDTEALPRRSMPLIFIVDTSGSMEGTKIGAVNNAIGEVLYDIEKISENNNGAFIKIAVLEFADSANWMYDRPIDVSSFVWKNLSADGLTNLNDAYKELNNKLSTTHGFMAPPEGSRSPALILLSDGAPTSEYHKSLETLKKNSWYKVAIKLAIAIGNDCDKSVLAEFVGSNPNATKIEGVYEVHNIEQLKNAIRTASITASQVATSITSVNNNNSNNNNSTTNTDNTLNDEATSRLDEIFTYDKTMEGVVIDTSKVSQSDDWGNY